MAAVQQRLAQLGLAKQSAKGTAASAPTYGVGLTGGKVYDVELEESELDTTWDNRVLAGYDRISGIPMVDPGLVAMPKSVGLLLLLGMGGYSVTGAGPFTHVFTVADTLPYATLWGRYGTSDSAKVTDAKLDSLEFEWDKSGAVKIKTKFMGCGFDPSVAFPTLGAAAETVSSGVMRGNGGTFTVDGSASRVTGGSIKIENALEAIVASNSVTPDDVFEARTAIEVSLKVKPSDLLQWRKWLTGSTSGTAVAADPYYGAVSLGFTGPSSSTLTFAGTKLAWATSMPEADPSGGAAELTVTGRFVIPASGSPLTATLVNSTTTY